MLPNYCVDYFENGSSVRSPNFNEKKIRVQTKNEMRENTTEKINKSREQVLNLHWRA